MTIDLTDLKQKLKNSFCFLLTRFMAVILFDEFHLLRSISLDQFGYLDQDRTRFPPSEFRGLKKVVAAATFHLHNESELLSGADADIESQT